MTQTQHQRLSLTTLKTTPMRHQTFNQSFQEHQATAPLNFHHNQGREQTGSKHEDISPATKNLLLQSVETEAYLQNHYQ